MVCITPCINEDRSSKMLGTGSLMPAGINLLWTSIIGGNTRSLDSLLRHVPTEIWVYIYYSIPNSKRNAKTCSFKLIENKVMLVKKYILYIQLVLHVIYIS